jgi:hypothetical protein
MRAVVFTPTGLCRMVEAESEKELEANLFEAAKEVRESSDY